MNYAHVAYYANLILEGFGYETEPVAFWREYPLGDNFTKGDIVLADNGERKRHGVVHHVYTKDCCLFGSVQVRFNNNIGLIFSTFQVYQLKKVEVLP